jgi:hypothetical protein
MRSSASVSAPLLVVVVLLVVLPDVLFAMARKYECASSSKRRRGLIVLWILVLGRPLLFPAPPPLCPSGQISLILRALVPSRAALLTAASDLRRHLASRLASTAGVVAVPASASVLERTYEPKITRLRMSVVPLLLLVVVVVLVLVVLVSSLKLAVS